MPWLQRRLKTALKTATKDRLSTLIIAVSIKGEKLSGRETVYVLLCCAVSALISNVDVDRCA